MNRIDRLLGYVLALQGGKTLTAERLAARFEISRRTVYRDLEALSELGVPITSTPGRGYSLMPGYHLPPVMLTGAEASALALAGGLFRHFVAHDGRKALEAALAKMDAVLPERTREAVTETRRRVCVTSWPHRAAPLDSTLPLLVQQAMAERRRLSVVYHSRRSETNTGERIDPHALVYYAGDWHLVGFSHRHGEVRQFRLSRMEAPQLLDEHFDMPAAEEAQAYAFWANNSPGRTGTCIAQVRFPPEVARWAQERRHYSWEREEETARGLVVHIRVDRWEEVLPWLLGWGGDAEVLSPPELRALLYHAAQRMRERYCIDGGAHESQTDTRAPGPEQQASSSLLP